MSENVSLEQATLHFLSKAQINASEADLFIAVRNHFAGIVQSQQAANAEQPENDSADGPPDAVQE